MTWYRVIKTNTYGNRAIIKPNWPKMCTRSCIRLHVKGVLAVGWVKMRKFLKSVSPYVDWYSFRSKKLWKHVFWKINFFRGVPHPPPNTRDPVYMRKGNFWKVSFSGWNHIPFGVATSVETVWKIQNSSGCFLKGLLKCMFSPIELLC